MFGGWNSSFNKKNTLQSVSDNDKDITDGQPPRKRQKNASRRNGPAHGRKQVSVSQREQLSRFFDEHDDSTQTKVSRKDSSGFNLQESSTNCQNNLLTNTAGEKGDELTVIGEPVAASPQLYDHSAAYNAALIQGQEGFNAVLRSVIRRKLFPRVKFLDKERDLQFNESSKTICGAMLGWLGIQKSNLEYKLRIWTTNYKNINAYHTQHRNNVIKKFLSVSNKIIKEGVTDVFNVTHMRGIEGRDSYIHCLYTFVNAFYRETDVNNLLQNECISSILTPSDEAFIMLCVMVYFRDRTDCKNDIKERDIYVSRRQGWRPEGIVLYNRLYRRVVMSRRMHGEEFDMAFTMYVETMNNLNNNQGKKHVKQVEIPYACNDLM